MIYTTLKKNHENGIRYIDLYCKYEECYGCTGTLFGDEYCTIDSWGDKETNEDKLFADYTDRQIAGRILKALREYAKDKEWRLFNWTTHKVFIDLDLPGYAYEQVEQLIKDGDITSASSIYELESKSRKRGVTIKKEYRYGENGVYCGYKYLSDLIDEYFPCNVDLNDGDCLNCGNC